MAAIKSPVNVAQTCFIGQRLSAFFGKKRVAFSSITFHFAVGSENLVRLSKLSLKAG